MNFFCFAWIMDLFSILSGPISIQMRPGCLHDMREPSTHWRGHHRRHRSAYESRARTSFRQYKKDNATYEGGKPNSRSNRVAIYMFGNHWQIKTSIRWYSKVFSVFGIVFSSSPCFLQNGDKHNFCHIFVRSVIIRFSVGEWKKNNCFHFLLFLLLLSLACSLGSFIPKHSFVFHWISNLFLEEKNIEDYKEFMRFVGRKNWCDFFFLVVLCVLISSYIVRSEASALQIVHSMIQTPTTTRVYHKHRRRRKIWILFTHSLVLCVRQARRCTTIHVFRLIEYMTS